MQHRDHRLLLCHETLRWREIDSNFRFRARGPTVLRLSGRSGLYDSSLEGDGFEIPVPGHGELCRRAIPPSSPDPPVRKQDASPLHNALDNAGLIFSVTRLDTLEHKPRA